MIIGYGCCVGSWDKLQRNVIPRIGNRPLMAVSGQTCIAVAYNDMLHWARGNGLDVLVLLHDDLEITDPDAEAKIIEALSPPRVGIVGVAGGSARGGLAWWNHSPIGHQQTDVMNIDFGERTGDVNLLEGSLLAFSRQGLLSLEFDEQEPGFHGYDAIAMQAHAIGLRTVVADIDTHHHTQMGYKSQYSHGEWVAADERFRARWDV